MSIDRTKLEEAIRCVRVNVGRSCLVGNAELAIIADAAEAHLATLPRTKMVEVWHVEYASNGVPSIVPFRSRDDAESWMKGATGLAYVACIRVTGPHQHEVPE